jgi:hypothetical protein
MGTILPALPIFPASLKLAITNMIERELLPLVLPHTLLSFEGGFHYTYNNQKNLNKFHMFVFGGHLIRMNIPHKNNSGKDIPTPQ